ncbi:MAG TPA: YciI family protein [Chryseosolibacter sp.]|nr:YciI family protein [Chryseosolibacter sp.]
MKYICLGYINEKAWESATQEEQQAMMDQCFAYDDEMKKNGHLVGGEGLQASQNATTLRWRNGKVSVTDGPFAETKEQIGGIMILEATDLNHAIRLLSNHPSMRLLRERGCWEIRPAIDLNAMIEESERRRNA